MTVFSLVFRTDWYAANGLNKDWSYDFALIEEAVVVQVRDAAGVISEFTSNFTFFPTDDSSGFVRYPAVGSALAAGNSVRITRWINYTQPTAIGAQGRFNPELHERGLDRATIQIQQLKDFADRTIKLPVGEIGGVWIQGDEDEFPVYDDANGIKPSGITISQILTALSTAGVTSSDTPPVDALPGRLWYDTSSGNTFILVNDGDSTQWVQINTNSVPGEYGIDVNARTFGDDGLAIQAAIDYLVSTGAGGDVIIPAGEWLVTGQASDDSQLTGIKVPYTTQINSENRIALKFSRGAVLKAASDDMIVLRVCDSFTVVDQPVIHGNGHTGVWGIAVVPEDMDQTSTRVDQSYTAIYNPFIRNCAEGIVYQAGPDVAGADSACYYNWIYGGHLYNCTRGIWRKDGPNASSSTVNAGGSVSLRIGGDVNTGIDNQAASGNSDIGTGLESINDGTSPNATPTAYRVEASDAWGNSNTGNRLISARFESNTRDLEIANARTLITDAEGLSGSKQLLTATPAWMTSGDPAVSPQIAMAGKLFYQNNTYIAGLPIAVLRVVGRGIELDSSDAFRLYDKGFEWATHTLTTANVTNTTSVTTALSKFQRTGGFVEWHFRIEFQATVGGTAITIALPRTPETAQYTTATGMRAQHVPICIYTGTGLKLAISAELGAAVLTIPAPSDTWNTGSSTNEIHGCVRYREQGV